MAVGSEFCCFHVLTAAKIVGIIGIIIGALQLIVVFMSFYYIPVSLLYIAMYVYALVGVYKKTPRFLTTSLVWMCIYIILSILAFIGLIALGIINKNWEDEDEYDDDYDYDDDDYNISTILFVFAGMVLASTSFNVLSFVIIWRARKWILENPESFNTVPIYPGGYNAPPPPNQVTYTAGPQHQQPQYYPGGYPQQGFTAPQQPQQQPQQYNYGGYPQQQQNYNPVMSQSQQMQQQYNPTQQYYPQPKQQQNVLFSPPPMQQYNARSTQQPTQTQQYIPPPPPPPQMQQNNPQQQSSPQPPHIPKADYSDVKF
uniref:Uncharacterized protein n=1 Tax=Panagrolaimus davidi TaxID=227884 RepID=A0A914PDK3_9BILA